MTKISINPPLIIKMWMDYHRYTGLATPWNTIYFRNKIYYTPRLLAHEEMHIEQMKRDGKLKFLVKYVYYWCKVGYWDNPYEIEAREAEHGQRQAGRKVRA